MDEKVKQYWKEVKEIEVMYEHYIKSFPLNYPKPLNLQEEKKNFFKALVDDRVYNPQIKFKKKRFDPKKLEEFKNIQIDTHNDIYGFKSLYKKRFEVKKLQLDYHHIWGNEESGKYAILYWGLPSIFLFLKAKFYCKYFKREKVRFRRITPKKIGTELKKTVQEITGNKIKLSYIDMPAKVNIEPYDSLIQINKNETFTTLDLKRLKVHEIGTHYMRYFNGAKQKIKILETGTANYLETEEGLAAYMEYLKGVSSKAQMFIYAGRVIASYYAPKKSFYEIFKILKKYNFRDDAAFAITYRVKRNLSDTSKHGGFTKDYVYFKGFHKVKKYAKRHDVKDLFIGKISLADIKVLKKFIKENRDKIITILDN